MGIWWSIYLQTHKGWILILLIYYTEEIFEQISTIFACFAFCSKSWYLFPLQVCSDQQKWWYNSKISGCITFLHSALICYNRLCWTYKLAKQHFSLLYHCINYWKALVHWHADKIIKLWSLSKCLNNSHFLQKHVWKHPPLKYFRWKIVILNCQNLQKINS